MLYLGHYSSPIGEIVLKSDGERLTGLEFGGHFGERGTIPVAENGGLAIFESVRRWLDMYFAGTVPDFTPPLRLDGTTFMLDVWRRLTAIPFGETTTYGAIAAEISADTGGKPMSAQAVGAAVGRNPIAIIVPCHRVVAADGTLHGYRYGLERKQWLLELERQRK